MSSEVEMASIQLKRQIQRTGRLRVDYPQINWEAYNITKDALLAVLPFVPEEVATLARELLHAISDAYLRGSEVQDDNA